MTEYDKPVRRVTWRKLDTIARLNAAGWSEFFLTVRGFGIQISGKR